MSYPPQPGPPYGAPPPPGSPYGPGQPSQPQHPAAASRRPVLLAALAGFLVAAVIAGVLVAAGVFDDDSDTGTSTASISLPDKVDSFVLFGDAKANKTDRAKKALANVSEVETKTAQALSAARDGAGAAVRSYVSEDLLVQFQIWAVRAPTSRPVVAYQNADVLGLAQPTTVVRRYGDTYCQLFAVQQTPKGQTPKADSYIATTCVRSSGNLSVVYSGGGSNDFSTDPARVARAVDEIWDKIS